MVNFVELHTQLEGRAFSPNLGKLLRIVESEDTSGSDLVYVDNHSFGVQESISEIAEKIKDCPDFLLLHDIGERKKNLVNMDQVQILWPQPDNITRLQFNSERSISVEETSYEIQAMINSNNNENISRGFSADFNEPHI